MAICKLFYLSQGLIAFLLRLPRVFYMCQFPEVQIKIVTEIGQNRDSFRSFLSSRNRLYNVQDQFWSFIGWIQTRWFSRSRDSYRSDKVLSWSGEDKKWDRFGLIKSKMNWSNNLEFCLFLPFQVTVWHSWDFYIQPNVFSYHSLLCPIPIESDWPAADKY